MIISIKTKNKRAKRLEPIDLAANILIVLITTVNVFPLIWLVLSSFKSTVSINALPPELFPTKPTLINFENLFMRNNAVLWTMNSFTISIVTTLAVIMVSSMAAYAFAKICFWGRDALFLVFISALMIPKEVYIIPLFKVMSNLGLKNTVSGITLPCVALPFGCFLLRQFFASIHDALRESAYIDGASEPKIFWGIMLPLAKPGIASLGIMTFVQTWNDYLWQMVMISKDHMQTLQIGISRLQLENTPDYGLKVAGATVAAVPMLLVFLCFQKYFTRGIALGAVKE